MLITCVSCRRATNHESVFACDTSAANADEFDAYEVLRCGGCATVTFRHRHRSPAYGWDHANDTFAEFEMLYPQRVYLLPAIDLYWVPLHVRTFYRELEGALRIGLKTLSAAGIRAAVEAALRTKGAAGRTLKALIDDASTKHHISIDQAAALHGDRLLGNEMLHELAVPTDEEISVAFHVLNELLTTLFITPTRAVRLRVKKAHRDKRNK